MPDADTAMKNASDRYNTAIHAACALPRGQLKAALDAAYASYSADCERAMGIVR